MNPTQNYHSAITHLGSSDIETVLLRVERGECNGDDANLLRNYIRALEARLADYEHGCLYWGGGDTLTWGGNSVPENIFQPVAEKHE
jgi:hypothetical protein